MFYLTAFKSHEHFEHGSLRLLLQREGKRHQSRAQSPHRAGCAQGRSGCTGGRFDCLLCRAGERPSLDTGRRQKGRPFKAGVLVLFSQRSHQSELPAELHQPPRVTHGLLAVLPLSLPATHLGTAALPFPFPPLPSPPSPPSPWCRGWLPGAGRCAGRRAGP